MPKMNRRTYASTLPYFHNFEHDPRGLKHCKGGANNPYSVEHCNRKHVIDKEYARGHGKGGKPQWFRFRKRVPGGFDLCSGKKVDIKDVPARFK